ncbi:hypothetical protein AM587_10005958 [Phytophthora nicotianae]|uniref:Uncharacterized protein n=1 Tax=Phytophthora nicotianae TaxID=4792 RepID=A0A0W8CMX6_PHYNI|nr:hypothetical protein AM587_10005958 [Phytophthora nicotianae]
MKKQWQTNLEIDLLKSAWIRKDREQHGAHSAPPLSAAKRPARTSQASAATTTAPPTRRWPSFGPLLRNFSALCWCRHFCSHYRDMKGGRPFALLEGWWCKQGSPPSPYQVYACVAVSVLGQRQSVLAAITMQRLKAR